MTSPLEYAYVSTEIFSIIVCFVLLYGNRHETHQKTDSGNMYSWMVFTNILSLLFDALSWVLEGNSDNTIMLYVSNTLSIVLSLVLFAQFALYISTYVGARAKTSKPLLRKILIFYSAAIVITLILCIGGLEFKIEDGVYVTKSMYYVYSVFVFLSLIISFAFVIHHRDALGRHDSIAVYIYVLLPTFCALINICYEDYAFTYQIITISLLILYVMIQSEQNSKLMEENQISTYYAQHDELTGLSSRRAYNEKLEQLKSSDSKIGVIFADINGLKYTNDNFGHEEGDKLIKKFADVLRSNFRNDDIYRISGDEFLVVVEKIEFEEFYRRVREMENSLFIGKTLIASIGSEYGAASNVVELIDKAEQTMYRIKDEFHKAHPEMQRGI